MSTPELHLRESLFLERRRRVVRGAAGVGVVFAAGLGFALAVRAAAPRFAEGAMAVCVAAMLAALLVLFITLHRHWRCPVCATRWALVDVLASLHWNHCDACGEALRAHPQQRDRERIARTRFALAGLSDDELAARFRSRRRRGLLGAGVTGVAALAALLLLKAAGADQITEQVVVALFMGITVATAVAGSRCPRCGVGVLAGRRRHCQRCGLTIELEATGPTRVRRWLSRLRRRP